MIATQSSRIHSRWKAPMQPNWTNLKRAKASRCPAWTLFTPHKGLGGSKCVCVFVCVCKRAWSCLCFFKSDILLTINRQVFGTDSQFNWYSESPCGFLGIPCPRGPPLSCPDGGMSNLSSHFLRREESVASNYRVEYLSEAKPQRGSNMLYFRLWDNFASSLCWRSEWKKLRSKRV